MENIVLVSNNQRKMSLCQVISPKPRGIEFTVIFEKEKQQNLIFKILDTVNLFLQNA